MGSPDWIVRGHKVAVIVHKLEPLLLSSKKFLKTCEKGELICKWVDKQYKKWIYTLTDNSRRSDSWTWGWRHRKQTWHIFMNIIIYQTIPSSTRWTTSVSLNLYQPLTKEVWRGGRMCPPPTTYNTSTSQVDNCHSKNSPKFNVNIILIFTILSR